MMAKDKSPSAPNTYTVHGAMIPLTIAGYKCTLYLPKQYADFTKTRFPVTYLLGESDVAQSMELVEKQFCPPFILLGIEAPEWEKDFSPWPEPPLVKKSNPFTGGAPAFLAHLESEIKPYVDSHYRTLSTPQYTAIAGYSLAGLTTLFALYTTTMAHNFASMSGSLWYEGWAAFCKNQPPREQTQPEALRLYLSLGNTEKNSRHPLMSQVDTCTQETLSLLQQQLRGSTIFFEYNDGGHFNGIAARIAKGLIWLNKNRLYPADYLIDVNSKETE